MYLFFKALLAITISYYDVILTFRVLYIMVYKQLHSSRFPLTHKIPWKLLDEVIARILQDLIELGEASGGRDSRCEYRSKSTYMNRVDFHSTRITSNKQRV
jgi:hypothetical protein